MPRACCDKFHTWLLWWCGGHNQMMVVGECFLSYFWESYGWRDDEGPSHVTDSPIDGDVKPVMSYQGDPGPDFSAPIPRTAIFTMLQILPGSWLVGKKWCCWLHVFPHKTLTQQMRFLKKKSYPVRDNNSDCDIKGGGFENYDGIEVTHCWKLQLPNTHLTLRKYGDAQQETKLQGGVFVSCGAPATATVSFLFVYFTLSHWFGACKFTEILLMLHNQFVT